MPTTSPRPSRHRAVSRILLLITLACLALGTRAHAYIDSLDWLIGDIKRAMDGGFSNDTQLTDSNYRAVLDGLKNNLKCNALRIPILYNSTHTGGLLPANYPTLYVNIIGYARSIGLALWASPIGVGSDIPSNLATDDDAYAQWIANYCNYFNVRFCSPFNESGFSPAKIKSIVDKVRLKMTTSTTLVGPDKQHVDDTIASFQQNATTHIMDNFDLLSSHNANSDTSATEANWRTMMSLVGSKRLWASEDPRNWNESDNTGVQSTSHAQLNGICLYRAYPGCVDGTGALTHDASGDRGLNIANNIGARETH